MVVLVAAALLEALMEVQEALGIHQAQAQAKEIMGVLGLAQQAMELVAAAVQAQLAQMPEVILVVMAVQGRHHL
jgi:hypothetical protein